MGLFTIYPLLAFMITAQLLSNGHGQSTPTFKINKDALKRHLENLFSNIRNEHTAPEEKKRVMEGIEKYFNDLKSKLPSNVMDRVEVNREPYYVPATPRLADNGTNIVMILKGEKYGSSDDKIAVVGAHYDSQKNTPGVDDNGSGMSSLLEIARVFIDLMVDSAGSSSAMSANFENTLIFAAFDQEEHGLVGSGMFAGSLTLTKLLPKNVTFQGAIILEMMLNFDDTPNTQMFPDLFKAGFPEFYAISKENEHRGDFMLTVAREDDKHLAEMIDKEWYNLVGGDYKTTRKYRHMPFVLPKSGNPLDWDQIQRYAFADFFRSDHYPFWAHRSNYTQNGLKAVQITDTSEFRGVMKQCYHKPCDDMSKATDENLEFQQIGTEAVLNTLKKMIGSKVSSSAVPLEIHLGLILATLILKFIK